MKLLIDENLPKKLKLDFPEHEIFTVSDMGWNSKKNGELLQLMLKQDFLTFRTHRDLEPCAQAGVVSFGRFHYIRAIH